MYQSGLFEEDLLEEWEVIANQSWDATKNIFGDQFGILTQSSNHEAKRSGFDSTNNLRKHPLSNRTMPRTPASTQSTHEYDALSEYAAALEDQVQELQSDGREATTVDSEMAARATINGTSL